jgi:hypothetical protein
MRMWTAIWGTLMLTLAVTTIGCGGKLEADVSTTTTVATPELVWETLRQKYNAQYPSAPLASAGVCQVNPQYASDLTHWVCKGSLGSKQATLTVTRDAKNGEILYQESP